ncbi:DUF418 domain-containing protein [Alteraurantiacibacter buctensis]|uniref:DUF418 domain-containing protein n=1 Tax=Alteraurantiacibacter buctensis TaxID=1503981 RepID=A0A844Z194_9SPHN|nr:DUF418 domain-containing protein [Alteraurantiacibacter buctensis]MXO73282.1 DUF418 domain-containing protein [Alteraurantiacibacter buctensis]
MGSAPLQTDFARPVSGEDRLGALDLIRGIAVLGILLANITAFAHPDLAYWWPGALPGGGNAADGWVWLAQFMAIDGKLRALFTLLFGAGLVLFDHNQRERHGRTDGQAMAMQARRLAWLGLFGVLHFFLLFEGDILFSYAVGGLLALFALRMSTERLVGIGVVWLVASGVIQLLPWIGPAMAEAGVSSPGLQSGTFAEILDRSWQDQLAEAAEQARVMAGDSYAAVIGYRLDNQAGDLASYASWALFETVPLIMLGMAAMRMKLFAPSDEDPSGGPLPWVLVALGLALNLATGLLAMDYHFAPYITQAVVFGTAPLTNLPLIAGLVLLLARWAVRATARAEQGWLVERLVLAGRMAFSNYIGTSAVMMLLFQGWAGGLFGTMHRLDLLLVVLFGWAVMIAFSRVWLGRFRYGPLEWLWRCLTYGRLFPNRLPLA